MLNYLSRYLLYRAGAAIVVWGCLVVGFSPAILRASTGHEQLIIFIQPADAEVQSTFQTRYLPGLRQMAEKMGPTVHVIDARQGVPAEVSITPMIVFQNFRGRSIYQGRTTTLNRIRNFIRTARYVPQGKEVHIRENIPTWDYGRTRIWAPLKIAPVSGTKPADYDYDVFVREAGASIEKGFKRFQVKQRVVLGRSDRGFYMDFYPWLSKEGALYLSLAVYSQFHCKEPVFVRKKDPLTGPWKDRDTLFARAAAIMEHAVQACIQDPEGGDGFDIIPRHVPIRSWQELGFPLPQAPEKQRRSLPVDMKIPRNWVTTDPEPDEPPMIQFRFPAPLDHYTGEVTRARGELSLSANPDLSESTGFMEADPLSVTMGESQLDQALQGSLFLSSKKYPKAGFVMAGMRTDGRPIGYGRLSPFSAKGVFMLKGRKLPLNFNGELEPVLGTDARPLLLARGTFRIDLRDFDIEGAEGPAPARYTLSFEVNLKMHEKDEQIP